MEGKIPLLTDEIKREALSKIKEGFEEMRKAFVTLEKDASQEEDERLQANAVWISGQMLRVFSEFFTHLKNLEKDVTLVQDDIQEVVDNSETVQ